MVETDDSMTDEILKYMKEYTWPYEFYKYKNDIFSRHVADEKLRGLITTMLIEDLISEVTPYSLIFTLTKKGEKVKRAGGWIKYKNDSMTEDERVHKLLEFMWTTNKERYDWDLASLVPAFSNVLNEYEIRRLCQILIENGDARDNRTKDGFSIGFIDESKSAFHSKKYLQEARQPTVSITTGDIGTIQKNFGTVHGPMNQSSDSSENKTTTKPAKTDKSVTKEIFVGVVVGLIVALILYYFFGVK